jgi:CRP/FNR family transcriptional regulator, dissimilatory nitrate respiration regulator
MTENLLNCSLFKDLKLNDLDDLFNGIPYQKKTYAKDDIIAHAETEVKNLLILIDGTVRGEMMDFSGKTVKIEDIESPNVLAPAFLFGNNNKFPVSIIANNQAVVIGINKTDFLKILQRNGMVLNNYLNNISSRAQFLSNKLRFLTFQSIKGKIAHYILQLSTKSCSDSIIMPKSQNQLAEMFGVTRPSLGRAIRELDKDGYIEANGKNIVILDKNKLSKLLK